MVRMIECPCWHVLRGEDDVQPFGLARQHVHEEHPEMTRSAAELRARGAADARDA